MICQRNVYLHISVIRRVNSESKVVGGWGFELVRARISKRLPTTLWPLAKYCYASRVLIDNFRKPSLDMDMDMDMDNEYRKPYEIQKYSGVVPEFYGLYCSMNTAVQYYPVHVVKHLILQYFYHGYGRNYHYPISFFRVG